MSRVYRQPSDGRIELSEHFFLDQFIPGPIGAIPAPTIISNLFEQAEMMEEVQEILGKPVTIFSGYGAPAVLHVQQLPADSPLAWAGATAFACPGFGDAGAVIEHLVNSGYDRGRMSIHGVTVVLTLED